MDEMKIKELEGLFENEDMQELLSHEKSYEGIDWDDLPEDDQEQLKSKWFDIFVSEMEEI